MSGPAACWVAAAGVTPPDSASGFRSAASLGSIWPPGLVRSGPAPRIRPPETSFDALAEGAAAALSGLLPRDPLLPRLLAPLLLSGSLLLLRNRRCPRGLPERRRCEDVRLSPLRERERPWPRPRRLRERERDRERARRLLLLLLLLRWREERPFRAPCRL